MAPLRSKLLFLLCGLGGLGFALAMPPYGLWPLAWVALVPLWCGAIASQASAGIALPEVAGAGRGNRWWRRWLAAVVWTACYEGVTVRWLWDLHPLTWMGIPWGPSLAIAIAAWLGVVVWRAGSVLLWTQLTARLGRGRSPALRVLLGVALWCAVDLLWSRSPLYWNSFALSQSPHNLAILQLGRLGGPAAVTGAIVAVNGLLAEAWGLARTRSGSESAGGAVACVVGSGQGQGRRPMAAGVRPLWAGALVLFLGLHGLGGLLYGQAVASLLEDRDVQPLKVGIVQGNVPTRQKLSEAGVAVAVERYAEGFRALAQQGADAVLLPEGALPFTWSQGKARLGGALLAAIAEFPQTQLWLGTFELPDQGSGLVVNQSLLALDAGGKATGRYNKVKLVPLGEYVPGEQLFKSLFGRGGRLSSLRLGMVPGEGAQGFETAWGRAAVMICYEPAFSEVSRGQVANGGRWIVNSANLDPYGEQLMAQSEALDVMRAVESDRWVVRATNTGFSGVVDSAGRVQWRSQPGVFLTDLGEIWPRDSLTFYGRWGDWLVWLLLGLAGVAFLFASNFPLGKS